MFLWGYFEQYYIFASFIFCISALTICLSFCKTRANYRRLEEKTKFETIIKVYRPYLLEDGEEKFKTTEVSSAALVPGDLVEIPDDQYMPCDFILIKGP